MTVAHTTTPAQADFRFAPTVVGSFPHRDPEGLVGRLLELLPAMPAWPQLPALGFRESMYVQYAEGLPGAVVDDERERLFFRLDEDFPAALEPFYEAVVEGGAAVERFAVGPGHARGLHAFLEAVEAAGAAGGRERPPWLKGQVTGPFSFAMTVTDEGRRALAYTPELCEVAFQGMALKARWLARRLRALASGALVVLDEPYLCSYGSAFVNVAREEVVGALETAVAAIHAEGALAGLHCCGNTDWSLVLGTAVDVVSFDAHDYFQGLSLYPAELGAFLERGGILAWGIVPTAGAPAEAAALDAALDERLDHLAARGLDRGRLERQALLTPSCGLGSRTVADAEGILETLVALAARRRERAGGG